MPEAAAQQETVRKPSPPMVVLRDQLMSRLGELRTALPAHISAERFVRIIITAVQINPDLLACDRSSLWNSAMRAANDGLLPDGHEAALVVFKNKVQYLPMYQGLLKKFRNSGQFKWVTAGIVFEGDEYDHWIDESGEHFKHRPADDSSGKKIRRVYAIATTKEGGSFIADLSLADIGKRKAMSRASRDDAPWKIWPDEMMKKTAIRVLAKLLPKSSDLDALIQRDEESLLGVEAVADARADRPSPQSMLDHFAEGVADKPAETTNAPTADSTGAEPSEPESETSRDPAAAVDPLFVAHERGKQARAAGMQRKAMPGEYRDSDHTREALCWQAGFDGGPLPRFNETS